MAEWEMTSAGEKILAQLEKLGGAAIAAGVEEGRSYPDGTPVSEVALYNEYGTSTAPARPFLSQAWENCEEQVRSLCGQLAADIADGGDAGSGLEEVGEALKTAIQAEILSGDFEPNAPATIARKGSSQPLVDTGELLDSITYEIREK